MHIYTTTDYTLFHHIQGNRGISKTHVNNLKKSLTIANCLADHPILVTKNMEIIDGQHRLEACKQLGLPVYYAIVQFNGLETIQNVQIQSAWKLPDYLQSYIAQGNTEYIVLYGFMKEHKVSFAAALWLLGGMRTDTITQFKLGKFKVTQKELGEKTVQLLDICRPIMQVPHLVNNKAFISAAMTAVKNGMDIDRFYEKSIIAEKKIDIDRTKSGYMHAIEDIYNYMAKGASRVRLY